VYVAEWNGHKIRKISTSGIMTVVAGTGAWGFRGDNGPATAAILHNPFGVWVTSIGDIYIGDHQNARVRKVSSGTNIITTVAGKNFRGTSGTIQNNVAGTSAAINNPHGLKYLAETNSLYFTSESYIGGLSLDTNIVTIYAGGGSSMQNNVAATATSISSIHGLYFDTNGNLYYSEASYIRRIDYATNIVTTVIGTGVSTWTGENTTALATNVNQPQGLYIETTGVLYYADLLNKRIRKWSTLFDGRVNTVCGTGSAGSTADGTLAVNAAINEVCGIAGDGSGKIYFAELNNHKIRVINVDGILTTYAGTGKIGYYASHENLGATSATIVWPFALWVDTLGDLYMSDTGRYGRVRKIVANTKTIATFAGGRDYGLAGDGGPATSASASYECS
jgi:hypothetical protein